MTTWAPLFIAILQELSWPYFSTFSSFFLFFVLASSAICVSFLIDISLLARTVQNEWRIEVRGFWKFKMHYVSEKFTVYQTNIFPPGNKHRSDFVTTCLSTPQRRRRYVLNETPKTSWWNVAKTSQWYVSTTSCWNIKTRSQEYVTTTSYRYVSSTSQTNLKWNTQRRLSGTYPWRPISTSLRRLLYSGVPNFGL